MPTRTIDQSELTELFLSNDNWPINGIARSDDGKYFLGRSDYSEEEREWSNLKEVSIVEALEWYADWAPASSASDISDEFYQLIKDAAKLIRAKE